MKTALVLGAGGFIGSHLAKRLKSEGYWVRGVDLKAPEFTLITKDSFDEFITNDLRNPRNVEAVMRLDIITMAEDDDERHDKYVESANDIRTPIRYSFYKQPFTRQVPFDEVYQLAADMGGALYVFSGDHDADIMSNSALINLNVAAWARIYGVGKLFYSSSACMYPQELQNKKIVINGDHCPRVDDKLYLYPELGEAFALNESMAYPANPDSEYGWEKLFSERLYLAYQRNYNLNVRIARFHNIYGPEGTYKGGREKAPAAMCRKVIEAANEGNTEIEVFGDGQQTRSFLYIDDCIDAVRLLMQSDFKEPINIGSEEMVSINELAKMAIGIIRYGATIKNVPSNALGVRGRNSDNTLIRQVLNWEPKYSLKEGLTTTFKWIKSQYEK